MSNLLDLLQRMQLVSRTFFIVKPIDDLDCLIQAAGRMRQPRHAARFSATRTANRLPAPLLGEHTDSVLEDLGLGAEAIAALRDAGIVA